jgi:hypothetical protein
MKAGFSELSGYKSEVIVRQTSDHIKGFCHPFMFVGKYQVNLSL